MKKKLIVSVVAVGMLIAAGVSAAADLSGFQGNGAGFYVGADTGIAYWKQIISQSNSFSLGKWDTTYGLLAGYMFNRNLGIEFDYDIYSTDSAIFSDDSGSAKYTFKDQNYPSLLSVFNFPLNQQWNVFAKVGFSYLISKLVIDTGSDSDGGVSEFKNDVWAPVFAVGSAYDITQHIQLTGQYKHVMESKLVYSSTTSASIDQDTFNRNLTPSYDAFTLGVNYLF